MRLIHNTLDQEAFHKIKNTIMSNDFPWYLAPKTNDSDHDKEDYRNNQLIHCFYDNGVPFSPHIAMLEPLFKKLKTKALVRVKVNLLPRTDKKVIFEMHTDNDFNCSTAIYYINTNNGETIFENNKKVKSEENKTVIFPSQLKHAGTTNTCKNANRLVLNINYF